MSDYLGQLDCEVGRELSYKLYSDIFLFNIDYQAAGKYFNRGDGCSLASGGQSSPLNVEDQVPGIAGASSPMP